MPEERAAMRPVLRHAACHDLPALIQPLAGQSGGASLGTLPRA